MAGVVMSEPLIVPSTPAEWEGKPEAFEPRCEVCRKHADDLGEYWCATCGCCRQHCQEFVDCPKGEPLECDDCGVEDGARWDIGPNNQWSVCDGCRDSFGYAEVVERNRLIEQIKDLLKPMF